MLDDVQKQQFQHDGYLILPDFKSKSALARLKARAEVLVKAHDFNQHKTIFSTQEQRAQNSDAANDYFLDSDNSIHCFFEEKAFDDFGVLQVPLSLAINKVGHAMHDLDSEFEAFSTGEDLHTLATDLALVDPKIWQSMYIFKQPFIGGKVDWHQDGSFFFTEPMSVITFWFAIDDATLENGCLWVQKGGHTSTLRERFIRKDRTVSMTQMSTDDWPDISSVIPLEVKAGTLVCFHGLLPHYSAENTSDKSRHAYTLHVTSAQAAYADGNWIQRGPDFPARGFIR